MAGKITITSSGIPGGSDTQVQLNDAGVFGGASQLFWDKVNNRLGIGIAVPTSALEVSGGALTLSHATSAPTLRFKDLADSDWFTLAHNRAGDRWSVSSNSLADILTVTKAGSVGIGDNTPAQQLSLAKSAELLSTTGSDIGVIYKGANRFFHDFHHPTGGSAVPVGYNVFIGENSGNFTMGSNATLTSHGSKNVGIGSDTLHTLRRGYSNIGIGYQALAGAYDGHSNMGVGEAALSWNTDGIENVAVGRRTLHYNVTGNSNVAIGTMSFRYNKGSNNVGIGNKTGYGANNQTDVSGNVCLGYQAGFALLTGGNNNTLIGYQAGDNVTTGEKNIVVGYDLDALSATGDYQLNIASTIFGDLGATKKVGINTSTMNETLNVGGAIRLGTSALTNSGTIRWTGADFEGYTGAAWASLTGGGGGGGSFTYLFYKSGSTYYAEASSISGLSDYSGATCHTVLQSAVDAIGSSGGSIYFYEGTYNFTGTVVGDHDIKFVGCGMPWGVGGTFFELDADVDMFSFTSKHCFSFEHITFDGNSRNYKILYLHGTGSVGASACHNIHLTKCYLKDCRAAIHGDYAYDLWLTDVNFMDCGHQTTYAACYAGTGCNTWHFDGCRWEGLPGRGFRSVKGAGSAEAFTFIDCKFHGWSANKYDAIYGDLYHSRIIGCFFYDTGSSYYGIYLTSNDNIIANNNFLGHDGTAIRLESNNNVVTGNLFNTAASVTHIDDNGTSNTILGNQLGASDTNNLLDYAGATTEKRLFNEGEVDSHIIKSDGTQTITNGNEWIPSAGTYNVNSSGGKLSLYTGGAWHPGSGYGVTCTLFCDGTNMKIINDSGSTQYVFWQKF